MTVTTDSFSLALYAHGNPDAKKLAILLPGFLDTKDHPHMRSHVDFLSTRGFYALSFDAPGTWESGGEISDYTMSNWLQSIKELVAHFGNRPTFVMGHSRGGAMAMLAAIQIPEVFAFASVMSKASYAPSAETVHPVEEWEVDGYKIFNPRIPGHPDQKKEFKVPFSVVQDTRKYNMLDGLRSLTKPKLFIAGSEDVTVKPEAVRTAFEASADPKQLSVVDCDHFYRRHPAVIDEVNKMVGEFLDKYTQ